MKSGSLNLLEPSGSVQACTWISLHLLKGAEVEDESSLQALKESHWRRN
jgi:hypothetical protein